MADRIRNELLRFMMFGYIVLFILGFKSDVALIYFSPSFFLINSSN